MRTLAISLTLFITAVALSQGDKEKGKTRADVKAMMQKTSKGDDSALGKISTQLKADAPDWAELLAQTKKMAAMADCLGECNSMSVVRVKKYQQGVSGLELAVSKKDKAGAVEARKVFLRSCSGCHYANAEKLIRGRK